MTEEETPQQSEEMQFNMSIAVLMRIDRILSQAAFYSEQRALDNWFDSLLALSREADYLMKEDEIKTNMESINVLTKLDAEYRKFRNIKKLSRFKDFSLHYAKLSRYGTFLRNVLNKRGMLMVKKGEGAMF